MSGTARMERKQLERFNRYWDHLLGKFPEYRRDAVEAMGKAVAKDLAVQIDAADLAPDAKGTVKSWQTVKVGSGGGYAAVRPDAQRKGGEKPTTWRGKAATTRQVTKWLDRGHGIRKPAPGSSRQWAKAGRKRTYLPPGQNYVKARQFYSFTKLKALDHALAAADKCLAKIEDEVEWE